MCSAINDAQDLLLHQEQLPAELLEVYFAVTFIITAQYHYIVSPLSVCLSVCLMSVSKKTSNFSETLVAY